MKGKATKLDKIYFSLLVIIGLTRLLQYLGFFNIPFKRFAEGKVMYNSFDINLVRDISNELKNLFGILSFISLWVGIILCIKNRSIQITRLISIFIIYTFTSFLFALITIVFSTNIEFKESPFLIISLIFFISTIIYYSFRKAELITQRHYINVTKTERLLNYLIDNVVFAVLFIVYVFSFTLKGYPNFEYLGFINTHIIYMYVVFKFFYYFSNEFLFHKTLGKIFNNLKVVFKSRLKDIFIRTLCRFIPFEILTFMSKGKGLHDKLSNTEVIRANK